MLLVRVIENDRVDNCFRLGRPYPAGLEKDPAGLLLPAGARNVILYHII